MNIVDISKKRLVELGLDKDVRYQKRLKWELDEIKAREKDSYFMDLYVRQVKYAVNQNNLLICWLLGITPDHDIDKEPKCEYGEFPDIDTDFLPIVRNYIKEIWAPKEFGSEYVCNISNYTTFGIKSALIDMARVHGESREQVQAITKNLDSKDDEGKALTWDSAMKLYPELKNYCELDDNHRRIADATKRLLHRNRGTGIHAGGLIIANAPLSDLVPLIKRKDSPQASSWVEGLHGQDLGPMGLVKFDLLVIANLLQLARCCEMVKVRHGLVGICNKPGEPDWTDVAAWRNDGKALAMANAADLKCIFQFDSDGMRGLVKAGGVDSFEDLVAYTALFRPGPLNSKMHERYIERKRGREKYTSHPLIKPILDKTYGVMTYQEQIMQILNVVGEIPLKDCELVRKAISKKKVEGFIKYKEAFILNGQKNLGCNEEEVSNLWDQIEAFAEYGFNKTIEENTIIPTPYGPKKIRNFKKGDKVYCVDKFGRRVETEVINLHDHGKMSVHTVTFDDGYEINCTLDHKFLTENGQVPLWKILVDDLSVLADKENVEIYAEEKNRRLESKMWVPVSNKEGKGTTSDKLFGLSEFVLQNRGMESSLWIDFQSQVFFKRTSAKLQAVSRTRMGRKNSQVPLWRRFPNYARNDNSFKELSKLQPDKKRKYQIEESEDKPFREPSKSIIYCCQENVSKTGSTSSTSSELKKMAGRKSRRIFENYEKGSKIFNTKIKNGAVVEERIGLGRCSNSVRQREKASGFSKTKHLDRSRWLLSFFYQRQSRFKLRSCARSHVKRRVHIKKSCNLVSFEHGMLCEQHRINENGMVDVVPSYAEITDTGNLVSRKIVRVCAVGQRQCYDLEVANPTHNFILPNGIVTSNSHAVAYTYISAWLLYLKAHYPHEFYAATLSCETLSEKIKEYKMEAKIHGVDMNRLDINKSKVNFDLQGDVIYFGLSNIKGLGEGPAKRIVDGQPYKNFEDFLIRFGTDANVLKPILGLRCFTDRDPVTLWKFSEHFKDCYKKIEGKKKRYQAAMIKYDIEFKELLPLEIRTLDELENGLDNPFDSEGWRDQYYKDEEIQVSKSVLCEKDSLGATERVVVENIEVEGTGLYLQRETIKYYHIGKVTKIWNLWKELKKIWQRRKKSIERYQNIEDDLPTLANFDASTWDIDEEMMKELRDPVLCEEKYYGFVWIHDLELSPDCKGNLTFANLNDNDSCGPVELRINKVVKTSSKKRKEFVYYQVFADDITGQHGRINVWPDDWEWWHKEFGWEEVDNEIKFTAGNLLRVRLQPPTGGFSTFTLESNQIGKWRNQKRYYNKGDDPRVFVMQKGQKKEEEFLTDEEAMEQFANCIMEQQQ